MEPRKYTTEAGGTKVTQIGDFLMDVHKSKSPIAPSLMKRLSAIQIDRPASELIKEIKSGLSFSYLTTMTDFLNISQFRLGQSLKITKRTMARRKTEGKFTPEESERIIRIYRIIQKALNVFDGDVPSVKMWLENPKKALGGETPIDFADTDIGAQEVMHLLGRIDHGVYS